MIKVDIVNEVSKIADITKVKAEVAVDAVFDAIAALHRSPHCVEHGIDRHLGFDLGDIGDL